MGRRASAIQHACRSEQECAGADGSDAARLGRPLPHPVHQRRIRGGGLGAFAAGDQKGIQQLSDRRERPRCERQPGRCGNALAALRHDPEHIGPRPSRPGNEIVGGGEHLDRARDVQQLHRRIREHVDDTDRVWRRTRGFWHFRQTMLG